MINERQLNYLDSLGDGAVHDVVDEYHAQIKQIADLERQRDELLAALEVLIRDSVPCCDSLELEPALYTARNAIAKAKGGAA